MFSSDFLKVFQNRFLMKGLKTITSERLWNIWKSPCIEYGGFNPLNYLIIHRPL